MWFPTDKKNKKTTGNTVHIAGRGLVVRQLRPEYSGSHRSSVSFGQERFQKSATTTCTKHYRTF